MAFISFLPENKFKNIMENFKHYMIYVNGIFVKDFYTFKEVQSYYNRYSLYGKITYETII